MAIYSPLSMTLTIYSLLIQHSENARATSRHGHFDSRTTASSTKSTTSSAVNGRRNYAATHNLGVALSHRRTTSSSRLTSIFAPSVDSADVKSKHVAAQLKRAWRHIFLPVTASIAPCIDNFLRKTLLTSRYIGRPLINAGRPRFTLHSRLRKTLSATCRWSTILNRWIPSFPVSRTNNVIFGSLSTTTTRKTSRH